MEDQIIINLRALDEETIAKLIKILDEQLNAVPDDANEKALEVLNNFETK